MNLGQLADYFAGVVAKTLSAVEVDRVTSNQHEFNGTHELRRLLGEPAERTFFDTKFIYLTDADADPIIDQDRVTWYDARANHPKRTEWRLYFPTTRVTDCASAGDILIIARLRDDSLLVIIAEGGTTIANQMLWLFGLGKLQHPGFSIREEIELEQDRLGFARSLILESIGIEVEPPFDTSLERMISKFGERFPSTHEFSAFARLEADLVDIESDPDGILMAWMGKEEILFRLFEKHLVANRLQKGFTSDVEGFMSYSLSVQNRRKSRVGHALENHLSAVFIGLNIRFEQNAVTENRSRPDFLFPDSRSYHDPAYPADQLTMLGAKSTCKDRWRQVLAEADRIPNKHLLTLETAISVNQTSEMQATGLHLIIPSLLHDTYLPQQRSWLMTLKDLTELVRNV